jgi:hypothetical protein
MNPRLRLAVWLVTIFPVGFLLMGCVEKRFVITTDPPSAVVYDEKGLPMGASPTDRTFVYYGEYQFTLVRDGYETQVVRENVKAPFYQWFLLDFFSENVIPWTIRDVRRFHYQLQPKQVVKPDSVLEKANELRQRGLGIGVPLAGQPGTPGPVTSALMSPAP